MPVKSGCGGRSTLRAFFHSTLKKIVVVDFVLYQNVSLPFETDKNQPVVYRMLLNLDSYNVSPGLFPFIFS